MILKPITWSGAIAMTVVVLSLSNQGRSENCSCQCCSSLGQRVVLGDLAEPLNSNALIRQANTRHCRCSVSCQDTPVTNLEHRAMSNGPDVLHPAASSLVFTPLLQQAGGISGNQSNRHPFLNASIQDRLCRLLC